MGAVTKGTAAITAITTGTAIIAAPGASKRLHVKKIILTGKADTTAVISVTDGTDTPIKYTPDYGHPGEINFELADGRSGWVLPANTALTLVEATGNCQVTAFAIAEVVGG